MTKKSRDQEIYIKQEIYTYLIPFLAIWSSLPSVIIKSWTWRTVCVQKTRAGKTRTIKYRVFHANMPITKRHFSASSGENRILKTDIGSSRAPILWAGFVYGELPRCTPVTDLYEKLDNEASALKVRCVLLHRVMDHKLVLLQRGVLTLQNATNPEPVAQFA